VISLLGEDLRGELPNPVPRRPVRADAQLRERVAHVGERPRVHVRQLVERREAQRPQRLAVEHARRHAARLEPAEADPERAHVDRLERALPVADRQQRLEVLGLHEHARHGLRVEFARRTSLFGRRTRWASLVGRLLPNRGRQRAASQRGRLRERTAMQRGRLLPRRGRERTATQRETR